MSRGRVEDKTFQRVRYTEPDRRTPKQRFIDVLRIVKQDAYLLGVEMGELDWDPAGYCLCEDSDPSEYRFPCDDVVSEYRRGWADGAQRSHRSVS